MMHSYKSPFLGIQLQIPDGWTLRTWPDDGAREILESYCTGRSIHSGGAWAGAIRPLVLARLFVPGSNYVADASIELQACSEEFLQSPRHQCLTWELNGINIEFWDDFRSHPPENRYYRFLHWQVKPGLWIYGSIDATGKQRFEYVLSIFETLSRIDTFPAGEDKPLFELEPWNTETTFFRLGKALEDNQPLYDLSIISAISEAALNTNQEVLLGNAPKESWTETQMRRRSQRSHADCYYGPDAPICSGIFSEQFMALLHADMESYFDWLSCSVDNEPYFILISKEGLSSCLDAEYSQIARFRSGKIMEIKRYRFRKDLVADPKVFTIPEDSLAIFATKSIPDKVNQVGLKGIAFYPVDGNGRDYTCPG